MSKNPSAFTPDNGMSETYPCQMSIPAAGGGSIARPGNACCLLFIQGWFKSFLLNLNLMEELRWVDGPGKGWG